MARFKGDHLMGLVGNLVLYSVNRLCSVLPIPKSASQKELEKQFIEGRKHRVAQCEWPRFRKAIMDVYERAIPSLPQDDKGLFP